MKHAFMIAGTHSSVGKTTVTLAVIVALQEKGFSCQAFKVGPDYIDPGYHNRVTPARRSRNLDSWLLSESYLRDCFIQNTKDVDIAVVEGVMGLYDGRGTASETGSSAEVAKILGLPVILVIDGHGLSRSAAAMALGYRQFDRELKLAGILLNGVSSLRHFEYLKKPIEEATDLKVIGFLPRIKELEIPERHLGLQSSQEFEFPPDFLEKLKVAVSEGVNLDLLFKLTRYYVVATHMRKPTKSPSPSLTARRAGGLPPFAERKIPLSPPFAKGDKGGFSEEGGEPTRRPRVRIGVAYDEAFSFYYEDNFDLLRAEGAEIVFFSPIHDERLPGGLDALYLGGGFPEVFAGKLATNERMRQSVREFAGSDRPIYAECGGLIYLAEKFVGRDSVARDMIGLVPGEIQMTDRLQSFGYKELVTAEESFLFPKGISLRSHEFHYSRWDYSAQGFQAPYRIDGRPNGFLKGNLLASYQHLHFGTRPDLAKRFVTSACQIKQQSEAAHAGCVR